MGSVFERLLAWFRGPKKEEEHTMHEGSEEPAAKPEEPVHAFTHKEYVPYEEIEEPAKEPEEPVYAFPHEEYVPYEEPEGPAAKPEEPEEEPEESEAVTLAKAAGFLMKKEVEA